MALVASRGNIFQLFQKLHPKKLLLNPGGIKEKKSRASPENKNSNRQSQKYPDRNFMQASLPHEFTQRPDRRRKFRLQLLQNIETDKRT
jgi:hypothetical protein